MVEIWNFKIIIHFGIVYVYLAFSHFFFSYLIGGMLCWYE